VSELGDTIGGANEHLAGSCPWRRSGGSAHRRTEPDRLEPSAASRLERYAAAVKPHVSRLLTTMDLTNRTRAAILAHEAGPLEGREEMSHDPAQGP
jgi:hypothetical protein